MFNIINNNDYKIIVRKVENCVTSSEEGIAMAHWVWGLAYNLLNLINNNGYKIIVIKKKNVSLLLQKRRLSWDIGFWGLEYNFINVINNDYKIIV